MYYDAAFVSSEVLRCQSCELWYSLSCACFPTVTMHARLQHKHCKGEQRDAQLDLIGVLTVPNAGV